MPVLLVDAGRRMWQSAVAHPLATVAVAALVTRLTVAVTIAVLFDGTLFLDDATYLRSAQLAAAGTLESTLPRGSLALTGLLTALFGTFGPHPLIGQVVLVLAGTVTAVIVAALVLRLTGNGAAALLAGVVVAFLPSQVLWSSLILKDALVWATLAGIALIVAVLGQRRDTASLAGYLGGCLGLLVLLAYLRPHTLVLAGWALVGAALVAPRLLPGRLAAAVTLAVIVPLATGYGLGGISLARGIDSLEDVRCSFASDGATAFVEGCVRVPADEGAERGMKFQSREGRRIGIGHLPRGLSAVLLEPFPWQARGHRQLQLAAAESVVWYPLLVLALLAFPQVWRKRAALAFPVLVAAGSLLAYALVQGNLGTAIRHRGVLVWVVALLAGLTLHRVVEVKPSPPSLLS